MQERWGQLEEWLAENAPAVLETLRDPATESEIDDVEREIGMELPPSVRESYRVHDGEARGAFGLFGCWRLLPLTEVVEEHERMWT